ncbi:helix-turn-helix transcriptional regulator [Arthrobacter sp. ISL-30]|nr:helix-turn-helix transcriptional regulator [Arthrobacter sp. ISL-30]
MHDSPDTFLGQLSVLGRSSEAQVRLNPLGYEQVSTVITETLGVSADADTTARILADSAGNPRLAARIAETAALSKLLVLDQGKWRLNGRTLWNDHLHGTIETLIQGLKAEELTGLHTMALTGALPLDQLKQLVTSDVLESLERRGFVAFMDHGGNSIWAAPSPPLLSDYFREGRTFVDRRAIAARIANILKDPAHAAPPDVHAADRLAESLKTLRRERGAEIASARFFGEQVKFRERRHFERWEAEKSTSNAVAFLRVYWGAPIDAARISQVFNETSVLDADPADYFFFILTKALWAIYSADDFDAATAILSKFGSEFPDWDAQAEAAALFLEASYHGVPKNLDRILEGLPSGQEQNGVIACIRAMLGLYRLDASAALHAIDSADGFDLIPHLDPFIRGLGLFAGGRIDESLTIALEQRAAARRCLDHFGFISSSYVTVLALIHYGYLDEAEHVMNSVFALGRPGFLADSLHDALLRLYGLRAAMRGMSSLPSVSAHVRRPGSETGALPGMAAGFLNLLAQRPLDPAVFEEQSIAIVEQQLNRGYVLEAAHTALFFLCVLPNYRVRELLRRTLHDRDVRAHDQLLVVAGAIVDGDYRFLNIWLDHYQPDADLQLVHMLLKGASIRCLSLGDVDSAEDIDRAAATFRSRHPANGKILSLTGGSSLPLTAREAEIAALAGHRSNAEIADHLGISVRTVENHISNALKKTRTASRNSLFELVRNSPAAQ